MTKIKNIEELNRIVTDKWSELEDIKPEYLSEAGHAAKEAYRTTIWHLAFHDSIESLRTDEQFRDLVSIPNKHPEYYRVLRMINRALERDSI